MNVRALLLLMASLTLGGCAPTAPSTTSTQRLPPITNPPGHVATLVARLTALGASPTLVPSETPSPTRTVLAPRTRTSRPPTITPTPIARRPAEPAPVVLSRAEAEARTLAWFLPEQVALVVAVTYVSMVDFWEVVDRLGGDEVMRFESGTGLLTATDRIGNTAASADEVIALVEVEAAPPRRLAPDFSYAPSWTTLPWDDGSREGGRRRIAYLFNATTGTSLGSPYLGDDYSLHGDDPGGKRRTVLAALRDRPIRVAVVSPAPTTATSTPTDNRTQVPTATPMPTSQFIPGLWSEACLPQGAQPVRLPPDAVPAPLAETVRWLPYVEGATWTYERTVGFNEAQWTRGRRQDTVEDRWRLAEDAMLVHQRTAMTVTKLAEVGGLTLKDEDGEQRDRWLILLPGASYEGCSVPLERLRDSLARGDFTESSDWWMWWDFLLEPRALDDDWAATDWSIEATQDLPTAWSLLVGQFHGCRRYGLPAHDYKLERKGYLCPNLGWIAQAEASCGQWFCITDAEVLTSYHIPRWHTVP